MALVAYENVCTFVDPCLCQIVGACRSVIKVHEFLLKEGEK